MSLAFGEVGLGLVNGGSKQVNWVKGPLLLSGNAENALFFFLSARWPFGPFLFWTFSSLPVFLFYSSCISLLLFFFLFFFLADQSVRDRRLEIEIDGRGRLGAGGAEGRCGVGVWVYRRRTSELEIGGA